MKSSGKTSPRSGSFQRSSASIAAIRPLGLGHEALGGEAEQERLPRPHRKKE
jgi:hypothetical protein